MPIKLGIFFFLIMQLKYSNILCRSVSSSVASLEKLLQVEREAVLHLENYKGKLRVKIKTIRSGLEMLREETEKLQDNEEAYVSKPLNAFSLMHSLNFDWYDWVQFLQDPVGYDEMENLKLKLTEMPAYLEFAEAVDAIYRLQNFHQLSANDMANGVLNGRQYDARFSALDAFSIARVMLNSSHFHEAGAWADEALRLYKATPLNDLFESTKPELNAFYAVTREKLGHSTEALSIMNDILSLDSSNRVFNERITEMEFDSYVNFEFEKEEVSDSIQKITASFCHQKFPLRMSKLHCRLFNKGNAFLRLAPFKVEELSLDPYMRKFYDVISDKEIIHLKEISRDSLQRAEVVFEDNYMDVVDDVRISEMTWLDDNLTQIVSDINKRTADMTGFVLEGAEPLQITNYGLAGHFLYHFDQVAPEELPEELVPTGDRIATVLIYMGDVLDGGETIFPNIEVVVEPQKGTAILWHNLDDRGDYIPHVGHIACPVVVGSKWVATKWIHERDQFRTRPCLPKK